MSMASKPGVVAEISVQRGDGDAFSWSISTGVAGDRVGHATSATEAVWRAVDALRCEDDQMRGQVAIYSLDGRQVASPPLWAVPQYELLEWSPVADPLEITGPGVL